MSNSALVILLAAMTMCPIGRAQEPPQAPDLTTGGRPDRTHDWNLGPTGARGWMSSWRLETRHARQILITVVDPGSPADGVLRKGDVVLGIGDRPFDDDARKMFGRAIDAAEARSDGALRLLRFRNGTKDVVTLKLAPLGGAAATAPYDCPKSARLLEAAVAHIARRGLGGGVQGDVDALALLAAGRPEHAERLRTYAAKSAVHALKHREPTGMPAWDWGMSNLFLAEYLRTTGDRSVLAAVRDLSRRIAEGRSGVGTWGHGMALDAPDRRLGGYGAVNQTGVFCWLSLVAARKAGVVDRVVDEAIDHVGGFFRFFSGKGAIPYGDHPPLWDLHDNNGKNAAVAIGFDLYGDADAARHFARTAVAGFSERELGHTGNYFGMLWGPLGAARIGDVAVAAHELELRWFTDLARRPDGSFVYQGAAGEDDSYMGWDATGAFALALALPIRRLVITGLDTRPELRATPDVVQALIADGAAFDASKPRDSHVGGPTERVLKDLGSWSPAVRYRAAVALAKTDPAPVEDLVRMLGAENADARYGAAQALEQLGSRAAKAVPDLVAVLGGDDLWLSIRAAYALAGIGKAARSAAVPVLLKLVAEDRPDDRRSDRARYFAFVLFLDGHLDNGPKRGLLADSIDGVDRALLYPAVRRILRLPDGHARSCVAHVYRKLTDAEHEPIWGDIVKAAAEPAPSGEMFSDGVRLAGLRALGKAKLPEGMRVALDYARTQNPWDSQDRMGEIMAVLVSYGAAAKVHVPELRRLAEACRVEKDFPDDCKIKKTKAVEAAVAAIEAAAGPSPKTKGDG